VGRDGTSHHQDHQGGQRDTSTPYMTDRGRGKLMKQEHQEQVERKASAQEMLLQGNEPVPQGHDYELARREEE
jgi:hypothetical protein